MGQMSSSLDLRTKFQVVMVGLDKAGKSTALYRLKFNQYVNTTSTIGFNCEKIKPINGRAKGVTFTIWDVGGEEKIRPLWRSYIRRTDALVFVVDSVDQERFEEARLELTNLLRCADMRQTVPIVVLSNKQDLPGSRSEQDVAGALGLSDPYPPFPSHRFHFVECCAVTGEGLEDFFDLLYAAILKCHKDEKTKRKNKR